MSDMVENADAKLLCRFQAEMIQLEPRGPHGLVPIRN